MFSVKKMCVENYGNSIITISDRKQAPYKGWIYKFYLHSKFILPGGVLSVVLRLISCSASVLSIL